MNHVILVSTHQYQIRLVTTSPSVTHFLSVCITPYSTIRNNFEKSLIFYCYNILSEISSSDKSCLWVPGPNLLKNLGSYLNSLSFIKIRAIGSILTKISGTYLGPFCQCREVRHLNKYLKQGSQTQNCTRPH